MAKSKLRMTGFARLLIAMIVILPLAFLGATFIKGGDGLADLKEMLGISNSEEETAKEKEADLPSDGIVIPPSTTTAPPMEKVGQSEEVMDELRNKLNEMYDENNALKEEIVELKKQLELKE